VNDHCFGHHRQVILGIRCPACAVNLQAHRSLELVRCINPHCLEFDRWSAVRKSKAIEGSPCPVSGSNCASTLRTIRP
jgi:hypothetical protein